MATQGGDLTKQRQPNAQTLCSSIREKHRSGVQEPKRSGNAPAEVVASIPLLQRPSFDSEKPTVTSGIRLGTAAATTRGFGNAEFRTVARMMVEVISALATNSGERDLQVETTVRVRARELCDLFPLPSIRSDR